MNRSVKYLIRAPGGGGCHDTHRLRTTALVCHFLVFVSHHSFFWGAIPKKLISSLSWTIMELLFLFVISAPSTANRKLFASCHEKWHSYVSNTQREGQANFFFHASSLQSLLSEGGRRWEVGCMLWPSVDVRGRSPWSQWAYLRW